MHNFFPPVNFTCIKFMSVRASYKLLAWQVQMVFDDCENAKSAVIYHSFTSRTWTKKERQWLLNYRRSKKENCHVLLWFCLEIFVNVSIALA